MTMTAEERAEVSRRNGRRSRGPATEAGRSRARQAARDRGLKARTIPLTHEDHQAVADRAEQWHDDLKPDTPLACHLINECARASVLADRCDRFLQASIEDQVEQASRLFHRRRRRQLAEQLRKLRTDAAAGLAGLKR